jgi:hypothetical protein
VYELRPVGKTVCAEEANGVPIGAKCLVVLRNDEGAVNFRMDFGIVSINSYSENNGEVRVCVDRTGREFIVRGSSILVVAGQNTDGLNESYITAMKAYEAGDVDTLAAYLSPLLPLFDTVLPRRAVRERQAVVYTPTAHQTIEVSNCIIDGCFVPTPGTVITDVKGGKWQVISLNDTYHNFKIAGDDGKFLDQCTALVRYWKVPETAINYDNMIKRLTDATPAQIEKGITIYNGYYVVNGVSSPFRVNRSKYKDDKHDPYWIWSSSDIPAQDKAAILVRVGLRSPGGKWLS